MSAIFCNECNTENHFNSSKCEQCKATLSQETTQSMHDEWENDFLYIENAEMKGKIFKLENLEEIDKVKVGIQTTTNDEIVQAIKEEPEFQIEPDFEVDDKDEKVEFHISKHPYQCSECNKCFKRNASLLSHTKAVHCTSGSDEESSDTKTQESTVKSKVSSKSYKVHLKYLDKHESPALTPHIPILKCDLCNESFADSNELNVHRSICVTKEKFFCDVCKIFVGSKSALQKHTKSRQHKYYLDSPPAGDKLKYVCLFCDERFPLQVLLTNHKKIHMEESKLLSETSRIERVDGRRTYKCTICGKSTTNKSGHTEHLRVHTKEKPVKCDLCGSAFTTRSSLVRHMNLHTDERPYECNICGKTYRHKRNLKKHLFMHTGQRPYKCKYCDKTFALRFTFNDHVRLVHTGETPYQCEECKESFKTSYLLNFHRRKDHNIDTNTKRKVKILNRNVKSTESTEEN